MTVKELIKKLQKCNPNAKVIIENDDYYYDGMYYVTGIERWGDDDDDDEIQVELLSNHNIIAKGWEE